MDILKQSIADAVYLSVKDIEKSGITFGDADLEFSRVTTLDTLVRVKDREDRGPRYFTIKVTENQ